MIYKVRLTETLATTAYIKADSPTEAENIACQLYSDGVIEIDEISETDQRAERNPIERRNVPKYETIYSEEDIT